MPDWKNAEPSVGQAWIRCETAQGFNPTTFPSFITHTLVPCILAMRRASLATRLKAAVTTCTFLLGYFVALMDARLKVRVLARKRHTR